MDCSSILSLCLGPKLPPNRAVALVDFDVDADVDVAVDLAIVLDVVDLHPLRVVPPIPVGFVDDDILHAVAVAVAGGCRESSIRGSSSFNYYFIANHISSTTYIHYDFGTVRSVGGRHKVDDNY